MNPCWEAEAVDLCGKNDGELMSKQEMFGTENKEIVDQFLEKRFIHNTVNEYKSHFKYE